MPSYYDNPTSFASADPEDVDKFNKVPFYLVKNEVEYYPQWNEWDMIFGDIPWTPNMGDKMKGVRPEPSPVGRSLFYPERINVDPKKDIFETLESTEEMQLRWHEYGSKPFSFLPSWQDFRDNQLNFNHKDIVKQVQVGNNLFIRTVVFDKSPNVYLAGDTATSGLLEGAPVETGNGAQNAAGSKTSAWLAAQIPFINKTLSARVCKNAAITFAEDLAVPFLEGSQSMPKVNEALKGRYLLLGSTEAWMQLDDDVDIKEKRGADVDLNKGDFSGVLGNGRLMFKAQRFPLRFNDAGTFIAPQLVEVGSNKTRPNPLYKAAKYEVAFMIGADAYRTVKVGPPPKDFSNVGKDKFYKMRWNGEIRLTDQFTIQRGSIAGGDLRFDLNDDGRFLKFKGVTTHGILAGEVYNAMPIFYKRARFI